MYRFVAPLWRHIGEAAWHFVTLPHDIADEIEELTRASTSGFGSVRVEVAIGDTTWRTSLFPDRNARSYLLPVKRDVREAERIADGDLVTVTIRLPRD